MATDLESPQVEAKFEVFVDNELARVRRRIRTIDTVRSLLSFLIVTLAYFLGMAAFDVVAKGADSFVVFALRITAFGLYLLAALYFVFELVMSCYRRINPYYAAKQLEETVPDAKNSVINWLDLRSRQLPAAIRVALGLRAARDLKQTDVDRAVDPKSNWVLGAILAGLVLGVLILFATGPKRFGSLVSRAFAPFGSSVLGNRTEIKLLKPAGDTTVPLNQAVHFQAQIEGRFPPLNQPGAPRVLYRYSQNDTYVALPLEEAIDGAWAATLLADQVQNGFWYKIAAGDAETPEYQVRTRSDPQATKYEITYRYRPYRKLPDAMVTFPDHQSGLTPRLRGPRGTEVEFVVHTNRKLKEARFEIESKAGKSSSLCTVSADDAKKLQAKIRLEQTGTFRLVFTSTDGEENVDRMPWTIDVWEDGAPHVVLKVPGKDVSLPSNGTLQLEGLASDDVGIKNLALRYRIVEGSARPPLTPKPYRPKKSFQFDNGTYPDVIDYKDFLALDGLKTATGEPFPLTAGMVLEYWLEAADNSDYPDSAGNVGRSALYKLSILDAAKDEKKQKEERKTAQDKQVGHEQKQDKGHTEENIERTKQDEDNKKSPEQRQEETQQQKREDEERAKRVEETKQRLQEELDKQQQPEDRKGDAKGTDPEKGEQKPGENSEKSPAQSKDQQPQSPDQTGQKKDEGKNEAGEKPGATKDDGQKDTSAKQSPSECKGPGDGKAGKEGQAKPSEKSPNANAQDKGQAKDTAGNEQPGQTKSDAGKSDDKTGQAKNEAPKAGESGSQAKRQDSDKGAPSAQAKNDKADGSGQNPQGGQAQSKDGPKDQVAQQKPSGQAQPNSGNQKDAGNADNDPGKAQVEAKGKIDDPGKAKLKTGPAEGKDQAQAHGKSDRQKDGAAGTAKDALPNQAKDSGLAKDDKSDGKAQKSNRELTAEDIAKLQEKLNRNEQADEAMQDLRRIADETKDPKVKKAAEDLMAKAGRPIPSAPPKAKAAGETENLAHGTPKDGGKEAPMGAEPKPGEAKDGNPQQGDTSAKSDGQDASNQAKAENKTGGRYANTGQSGSGIPDEFTPDAPNIHHAQRGGDLQLEDLKKRMTPEMRKKAGLTEEDWQRFLKDAEAYNQMIRRQQAAGLKKDLSEMRGNASFLPTQKARDIVANPAGKVDPLQSNFAQPPLEFRDAQRAFTNRPPKGP